MKKSILAIIAFLFFTNAMYAQESAKVYTDFSGKWLVNSKTANPLGIDSLRITMGGDTLTNIMVPLKGNPGFTGPLKNVYNYTGKETSEYAEFLGKDISYTVSWNKDTMLINNSLEEVQEWSLSPDKKQLNIKFVGRSGQSLTYVFDKVE